MHINVIDQTTVVPIRIFNGKPEMDWTIKVVFVRSWWEIDIIEISSLQLKKWKGIGSFFIPYYIPLAPIK